MRCLEKRRERLFESYTALREALLPFGTEAPEPAPLGLRFVAGLVDELICVFPYLSYAMGIGNDIVNDWLVPGTSGHWSTSSSTSSFAFPISPLPKVSGEPGLENCYADCASFDRVMAHRECGAQLRAHCCSAPPRSLVTEANSSSRTRPPFARPNIGRSMGSVGRNMDPVSFCCLLRCGEATDMRPFTISRLEPESSSKHAVAQGRAWLCLKSFHQRTRCSDWSVSAHRSDTLRSVVYWIRQASSATGLDQRIEGRRVSR